MSASRDFRPSTSFVAAILLLAALFCAAVLAAAPGMGAAPAWALSTVVVSTPADGAVLVGTTADITGMASGDQDLTSVEVSTDGGATWALAAIESGGGTTSLVWRYAWTLPAEDSSTDHVILARVTDTDGSVDTSSFNPIVRVDTLAPAVTTFFVNGDAAFTGSTEATLTIEAFDGSPPMAMQFSNDGTAWGDWWPYGTSATWTLASGDGLKVVRARFRDAWGNVTPGSISDTISLNSVGPAITGRSPAHGAAGVGTATFVQAAFSTSMDPVSLSGATVQLWLDGDGNGLLDPAGGLDTQVTGSVSYDDRTRTVIVRPGSLLVANSTYFFRLTAEVSDLAGLTLGTDSVTSFTTGVSSPLQPGISAITPTDGSAGVPVTSFVTIVFDREMDPAGIEAGISLVVTTSGAQVAGAVVLDPLDARVVHFYPAETLDVDTGYTVTVSGTLQDYFGETLGSDIVVAFSTGATGFNPHGTFNAGSSVCAICHSVHDAAAPSFFGGPLLRSDSEAALCYTCHDGSGATTDVRAVFESMGSGHVLEDAFPGPGAGLTTRCSSCHDPHADGVNRPKLPPTSLLGVDVTGNNYTWCEACHDDGGSWAGTDYPYPSGSVEATSPLRAADGYPTSGTYPGATAYNDTLWNAHNPVTSTQVVRPGSGLLSGDCRNCHLSHRGPGQYDALVAQFRPTPDATSTVGDRSDGTYAELCFICHGVGGPSEKDIKQFTSYEATATGPAYTGGHRVMTAGGTLPEGAPLPCYDCHNPHGSKGNDGTSPNRSLLSDEQWSGIDTSTTAGVVGFCTKCHLPWEYAAGSGQPEAGTVPTGQLTRIEGLDRTDPVNKLSLIPGITAHERANMENPTASCYLCHLDDYDAPSDTTGYNVHRPHPGRGGCVGCHSSPQGSRRAVVGEFGGAGHHVVGGQVTDADCGVCHMERDATTASMDLTFHENGAIDLRQPDSGAAIAPITALVRNTASNALENEVLAVQSNLCLACHDANGAASTLAQVEGATAQRPFSANSQDAANIYDAFNPANGFSHAVLAPGVNPFTTATATNGDITTMVPPWNQGGTHDLISCFDCHVTSVGHGGTFEAMGRTDLSTAAGQRDLCVHCHAQAVYQGSGEGSADGSRFADHYRGVHQLAPSGGGRNPQGCRACHAGLANNSGLTANGSPGNIHGGNYTWGEGPSAGSIVQHFMYGGYLSGWSPGTCWAGSCHGGESY